MLKEAYTTKELSELLDLAVKNVLKVAVRHQWRSVPREGRGGGSLWLYSSMPLATQLAIRTAIEKQNLALCENIISPAVVQQELQTRVLSQAIMDDNRRCKALAKADLLAHMTRWQDRNGYTVEAKETFIHAYHGGAWPKLLEEIGEVSWKSIERWKNAVARSETVLVLADKRGVSRKGQTDLTEVHKTIILGQILNPNAPNVAQCSRRVQKRCEEEHLWVPSDATIRRFVMAYMEECFDEWTLWREGKKAWNDKCAISILRDWSLVQVGDIVIADGHTLNFETINPDTGKAIRMTLLLFYDGASNHPLGWEVMPTENIACISAAFRRTCMVLGKIPRVVYLDNGKAFRAKFFKGIPDFEQAQFLGLYRDLGCNVIHAWSYHGQSKTIERFFGTMLDMEVFVPSYTGNSIDNKPARMKRGEVMHNALYKKMGGRPLTLEETHLEIARWFSEYVMRPQHRTHLKGKTPHDVFQAGRGPGVDMNRLVLLMMQKTIKTIYKDGIKHLGKWYWHEALSNRRHPVMIRYDELMAPTTVYVYTLDGNFICEALDRNHYNIACNVHPAAKHLGTAEDLQNLEDAIALKRRQENAASYNMRQMLENVVLPESRHMHGRALKAAPEVTVEPIPAPQKQLSEAECANIEAKKAEMIAQMEAEKVTYKPSSLIRFKDAPARYDYLFRVIHEEGKPLTPEDAAWLENYEGSESFIKYYKRKYDAQLELFEFRRQAAGQ